MNPQFPCDHMHEVGRGTDSGKEWNYASWYRADYDDVVNRKKNFNTADVCFCKTEIVISRPRIELSC